MPVPPVVSVVIGSFERGEFLRGTIATVREELEDVTHEIVVVDGGSGDGTVDWLVRQKDVVTIVQHNRGEWRGKPVERRSWGYFMNLGFKTAQGMFVCMLSDDCLVVPGAIRNAINLFERESRSGNEVGAVAFYFRDWPGEKEYRVGRTWGNRMFVNHGLYRCDALRAVGYADEATYSFYHADGDLSLRMWEAGYACIDSPDSFVEHRSHTNVAVRETNRAAQRSDWAAYTRKWASLGEPTQPWTTRAFVDPRSTAERYWHGETPDSAPRESSDPNGSRQSHRTGLRRMIGRARRARAGDGQQVASTELDPVRLQLIRDRRVQVVLDVGANEGHFARRLRANGYRGRIVSFEPLSAMFAKLEAAAAADPNWICLNVALGAKPGRLQLNRAANWASSSLLPMKPRHSEAEPRSAYVGTQECEVARLDDLRAEFLEPDEPAYLKLDVQGFELEVLRGAAQTLEPVEVVEAELSLVALYDEAPLFGEVVHYLDERSFGLLGLEPGFADPRTGALLQVDGLFARG